MKKKIIYLILMLICITGCNKNDSILDITFSNIDDCNRKPQLLIGKDNINIYTYCINNIKVNTSNKQINLKEYLANNDNSIENIIKTLILDDVIYDGGTKIYKGNNITLIKCNTLEGNKDIYIGNSDMKYKSNFCKENNYTFFKTYTILSASEYTKQQYTEDGMEVTYGNSFEVKLKDFKGKEDVVIINNIWDIKLEKDKTYEFEFMLFEGATKIEDSIEYIFKNSQILEIKENNKGINNQINEKIKND